MTYWPGVAWGGAESSGVHEEGTSRCLAWGVDGPCLSPDFTRGSFCESEEDTGPRAVPGMSGPSQVPSGRRNRARVHAGSLTKSHPRARTVPGPPAPALEPGQHPGLLGRLGRNGGLRRPRAAPAPHSAPSAGQGHAAGEPVPAH